MLDVGISSSLLVSSPLWNEWSGPVIKGPVRILFLTAGCYVHVLTARIAGLAFLAAAPQNWLNNFIVNCPIKHMNTDLSFDQEWSVARFFIRACR